MKFFEVNDLESIEAKELYQKLNEFNAAKVGPSDREDVAVFVKNDAGALVGGITGFTSRDWLFVSELWIDESYRSDGLGSKLLARVEEVAKKRGMVGAYLDTYSFQAPEFYQKCGYRVFGEVEDHPRGYRRIFLQKVFQ